MVHIHRVDQVMQDISKISRIKKDKKLVLMYVQPNIHLGEYIHRHQEPEDDADSFCYAISDNHYVKNVVAKSMCSARDLSIGSLGCWGIGYRKDSRTKHSGSR